MRSTDIASHLFNSGFTSKVIKVVYSSEFFPSQSGWQGTVEYVSRKKWGGSLSPRTFSSSRDPMQIRQWRTSSFDKAKNRLPGGILPALSRTLLLVGSLQGFLSWLKELSYLERKHLSTWGGVTGRHREGPELQGGCWQKSYRHRKGGGNAIF